MKKSSSSVKKKILRTKSTKKFERKITQKTKKITKKYSNQTNQKHHIQNQKISKNEK